MSYNRYRPTQSLHSIVINLIILNVLVFLAQKTFDGPDIPGRIGPFTARLALWDPDTGNFRLYELITHMFAHAGFFHILFNMYALWLFGTMLERAWGAKTFLIFYIICGLGAALAQMYIMPSPFPAIGASGAVMGLMAAFAYTYPNVEFYIIPLPFAIKAKWLVVGYALIDLFGGVSGSSGIAHFAHLGGLVTGFILMIFWISKRRNHY